MKKSPPATRPGSAGQKGFQMAVREASKSKFLSTLAMDRHQGSKGKFHLPLRQSTHVRTKVPTLQPSTFSLKKPSASR